jgi:hypothetical protein
MACKIPKLGEKGKAATLCLFPRPVVFHAQPDVARSPHGEPLRTYIINN